MTRRFRIFDLTLDSDLEFPELAVANDDVRHLVFRRADARECPPPNGAEWIHAFHVEGAGAWLRVGRNDGAFILAFRDFLTVRVAPPDLIAWPDPELPEGSLRHLVLNQVLPMAVAYAPRVVLHAACVARSGCAVLLAGPAGVGKSTLAAALALRGWEIAGDDAVAVDVGAAEVFAETAYAGWRLWPDTCAALGLSGGTPLNDASAKRQFRSTGVADTPVRLSSICVLAVAGSREPASLERLSARSAVMGLVRNSFVLDPQDRDRVESHLNRLSEIAARIPVCELRVPRGFRSFAEIDTLLHEPFTVDPSPCR